MNLFFDIDSHQFVTSPFDSTPVLNVTVTRGDVMPVDIGFVQDSAVISLPSDSAITLGFKQSYSGAFLAYATNFASGSNEGGTVYSTLLSLANSGIDALFTGNATAHLIGQLSYGVSGLTEVSSATLGALVQNDINTPSGIYPANSFVSFPATSIAISSYTLTGNQTLALSGNIPTEVYYVNVAGAPSGFTGNLCLQAPSGTSQILKANVTFPISGYQVVNVFDTSPSGNLLYWFSGDGTPFCYYIEATHTAGNWQLLNVGFIPAPNTNFRIT